MVRSGHRLALSEAGASSHQWPSSCAIARLPARLCSASIEGGISVEFAGKVALITGGGGGIGRAAAIGFAGRGAKVVVVDLNAGDGEASAELVRQRGGEARFVRADVTKSADVAAYVK